jgi:hypothetical protein
MCDVDDGCVLLITFISSCELISFTPLFLYHHQVHNAMWTHFTDDLTTLSQDGQYMWSDSLLFTPVLVEGATDVTGYFPRALWYSLTDGGFIDSSESGQTVTFDTPVSTTNVHVRGGSVVPMQDTGMTTKAVKDSPFTLLVALDEDGTASGSLFLDDGIQNDLTSMSFVEYTLDAGSLVSDLAAGSDYDSGVTLNTIEIRGIDRVYGTECTSELTLEVTGGESTVIAPTSSDVTMGDNYATLILSFDGEVNIASDFVLSFDCSGSGGGGDDDDDSVLSNVYVVVAISVVSISAFVSLLFVGSKMLVVKSKGDKDEALLNREVSF